MRWRRKEEFRLAVLRSKHVAELTAATERHREECKTIISDAHKAQQRYYIALNEMVLDSEALILACNELACVADEDTDEPAFGESWQEIRKNLRQMASRHNRETMAEEAKKSFMDSWKVEVKEE